MTTLDKLRDIAQLGVPKQIIEELNPSSEYEIIQNLEASRKKINAAFLDKNVRAILNQVMTAFADIETVEALLKQKVYLNEFSNKYGKKYVQARTSHVKSDGKTSWVNAYVGPLDNFKQGLKDPEALKIGRELMRKKLIEKGVFTLNLSENKN